jgi:hypothetical protein
MEKMLKTMLFGLVVQCFIVGPTLAAPLTLKCVNQFGNQTGDHVVDLDRNIVRLGSSEYTIHSLTDRYISANDINDPYRNEVGGTIYVLDRITGQYMKAWVHIGFDNWEDALNKPGKLAASTVRGTCSRKLL